MPINVSLGLPTLDRSLFGRRRSDRSSTSSSPVPGHRGLEGHIPCDYSETEAYDMLAAAPPELPPLGNLNGNDSFVNLLAQLDAPSSSVTRTDTERLHSIVLPSAIEILPNSPAQLLRPRNVKSNTMSSMEFVTTGTYFSTLATSPPDSIPERHQSSTSSASYSKDSDTFSVQSESSRSSVEDAVSKAITRLSVDPISIHPLNIDFITGFRDRELDHELSSETSPSSPIPSIDVNKPLPPPPTRVSASSTERRVSTVQELDASSVSRSRRSKSVLQASGHSRSNPQLRHTSTMRQSSSSQCLVSEDVDRLMLPRRNSKRLVRVPQSQLGSDAWENFSGELVKQLMLQIMLRLSSISDLRAVAMVNKKFYDVFKNNESKIVENVLRTESQPAWELRQLVKCEQGRDPFQIRAVQRDMAALRTLQAFIFMKCDKLCRKSTLSGLAGKDESNRAAIDNALWRIWTFCKMFGKGTSRDASLHAQLMWLEGTSPSDQRKASTSKATPIGRRVSGPELEDMSEMWRCMEALLAGFRGRESEAREAGIFDQCKPPGEHGRSEAQYLEDWIYDILSVGPKAVLTMISCSFEHAKVLGVNKWTPPRPGRSRRPFLKAALEQVYRDRLVDEARMQAEVFAKSIQHQISGARPLSTVQATRQRVVSSPAELDRPRSESIPRPVQQASRELPRLDIRPDCDPQALLPEDQRGLPVNSPTTNPAAFSSLAMMSGASARLGATLFPLPNDANAPGSASSETELSSIQDSLLEFGLESKVVDPTDRALSLLVKQLGIPEYRAKQALAMSDSGTGIDVNRAVELLNGDRRLDAHPRQTRVTELPDSSSKPTPAMQQLKEYCEGTYRRASMINRKRSSLRGLMKRNSLRHSFPLDVIIDREDEDSTVHQLARSAMMPSVPMSMPLVQTVIPESGVGYQNLTEFLRYRSSTRLQNGASNSRGHAKGHRRSSSDGSIDHSDTDADRTSSPALARTPLSSHVGWAAVRPLSEVSTGHDHGPLKLPMSRPRHKSRRHRTKAA